ncbi:PIG-P-domain-containing protein [Hygrophoropsis aurantiaca]|uniref:PIG-P-domain-containing protein n=1 Tax=Hygrophoropsis aurantiaca TaxID=72124 RepID=A0ACB8A434_9AGAM|nr:PIG-P-domain-containing protein [Hygrophoropsis aurantiaca]
MSVENPTSPVSPLAHFPPAPPEEYRSRAPEFYGFVAWTSTTLVFILFLLWALLPDDIIVWIGVKWYPSREWALLLPAYSVVLVLLTYCVYFSLAIARTPAFSEISAFIDSRAHLPAPNAPNPYLKHADPNAIPELYDIPIGIINRVIYGPHRRRKGDIPTREN